MIRPLLAALCLLIAPLPAQADAAIRAYGETRFEDAYDAFRAALDAAGGERGALLYGLGTCALRLGRPAEAALLLRRALLRRPADPRIAHNLRLAERALELPPIGRETALPRWLAAVPPARLAILAALLQTGALAGLVLLSHRRAARWSMGLLLLLGLAGSVRLAQLRWIPPPLQAVVIDGAAAVHTGPHDELPVAFAVRAGEVLRVIEHSDRWARVAHRDGDGWISRRYVGLVD